MSTALAALTTNMANRFELGESNAQDLMVTLKATAFKGQVTDAQMTALMLVAQQYGLNPWTREIYAFPDRQNGIVPVVGVDGWARIINENPQFDGMEFEQDESACTCKIYRKDRSRPTSVTEYMEECRRQNTGPWQSHPKRMLRHKAMIQCARLAFGFGGIFDQDEAERIVETQAERVINPGYSPIDKTTGEIINMKPEAPAKPIYTDVQFDKNRDAWRSLVESGKKSADDIIKNVETKATMTEAQKEEIRGW
jgi:phage recombination protein Bet